jgi:small subunit ribosomal protein S24e
VLKKQKVSPHNEVACLSSIVAMAPATPSYTIRTKKFLTNPLLSRKQFVVEIVHPNIKTPSRKDVTEKLATMYKVKDSRMISVFGFKTLFGGGRTQGFGLIYDSIESTKKFEPKHRQRRSGLAGAKVGSRRVKKELKLKAKKSRGKEKGKFTSQLKAK